MKSHSRGRRLAVALALFAASGAQRAAAAPGPGAPLVIYDDAPQNAFEDGSWFHHVLAQDAVVHSGRAAISMALEAGGAFRLRRRPALPLAGYQALTLWVYGDSDAESTPPLEVQLVDEGGRAHPAALRRYLPGGRLPPRRWMAVRLPLAELGVEAEALAALQFVNRDGRHAGTFYLDDIALVPTVLPVAGGLRTVGNKIVGPDGQIWAGRGANIQDTRSCSACLQQPDAGEVMRRIDDLVDHWGANFVRLTLESYQSSGVLTDAAYAADLQAIVAHIGSKPGVYVEVSMWIDPTLSADGLPTAASEAVWRRLVALLGDAPHVLFGLSNEPFNNDDGRGDLAVWETMNALVATIRDEEAQRGQPSHLVAVQGTGGWGRYLQHYMGHPIAAGGGQNVVYETHVYAGEPDFEEAWVRPATALPVLIGEFGPAPGHMSLADCAALMDRAERLQVPYLAWTFHMRCPPNLLEDSSGGACGIDMPLAPTPWGRLLKAQLSGPPAADGAALGPAGGPL